MKIFFPDIHYSLTNYFAKACENLGHEILIPSKEWKPKFYPKPPVNHFVWNESWDKDTLINKNCNKNIQAVSKEKLFDLKPEIIFVTAFENQFEVINEVWNKQNWGAKLCFYSGNDYWKGAYPLEYMRNYLAADLTGIQIAQENNLNYLKYIPFLDEKEYQFAGQNDSNIFITAIGEYHKLFRNDFIYYNELKASTPFIQYDLHTKSSHEKVIEGIKKSSACLHVKSLEGMGLLLIESILLGRPPFIYKPNSIGKRYQEFLLDEVSAIYFENKREYIDKSFKFINNKEYRNKLQESTAKFSKEYFDNKKNLIELNQFLNKLK
jgi:hypothetical protein